ncbi:hypothetical protein PC128_g5883 [Phytophthora cactorum]|nr:hypothetical protein PC128_g5883 [Phytophthora cactorum]KAG4061723.1 hypothetical protein PC123_g3370 [Phytophthora cactorum]
MYGAPPDDRPPLQEALQRLQHEKSEADGMLRILTSKLREAEDDNFDLRASMSLFEAETKYESDKKEREMQKRQAALESKLAFMSEKLQNAERVKLRAIKEVEELQQKHTIETKRRDAERRLMATRRRKHESFLAASQSMRMSQQLSQHSQQVIRPPPVPVVETAVQTDLNLGGEKGEGDSGGLKEENAKLLGENAQLIPDDDRTQPLQGCHSSTPSQFVQGSSSNSLNDSMQQSASGVPFSQSVFSQLAGRASAQAHASILSVARENNATQNALATERARELYDVIGKMLAGDVSAVALAPVLVKYLAAPADLEWTVTCSVLRVMYSVMHHSLHFQHFLLVASSRSDDSSSSVARPQQNSNSIEHPRIALSGLRFTSLDDYLSARSDYESVVQSDLLQLSTAEEQRQLRLKLMSALCRVIKNNLKEPAVVKDGLCVLGFWVDLGLTHRPALTPDFKTLVLLRVREVFTEVETESKKSFLFNRCAKMLTNEGDFSVEEAKNLRPLQHQIVKLLLSIATSFPAEGIRFVLESTHGLPGDADGYRIHLHFWDCFRATWMYEVSWVVMTSRAKMKFAILQTLLLTWIALCSQVVLALDKTCFELPIVIVSPTKGKLPTETCNQPRLPAPDCMRDPVEANIEVIDNANGTLNCLGGNRTAVYPASVHYRGQSSLHFMKHQIGVELNEDGELLGFPADRTFVLNGPTVDASLMRNHLAHWMFRGTDRYSPRTRLIVVFVRDRLDADDWSPRYRGVYLALEKIAYTPNRVGLTQLNSACQTDEELSGGWAWQNNPLGYGDYSPNVVLNEATGLFGAGARPILVFPEPKVITQTMRDYFVSPKTGPLPRLYQYLYDNMTHPDGLEDHIDIGSFVDYFLHSELSMNSDAYRRSTYFFKDRSQPINAGPVWDFNLAYGKGGSMTSWLYTIHTFWKRLSCNYKFASLVQQRWVQLRSSTWSDESIKSFIQTSAEPIRRQLKSCVGWKSDNLQCANVDAKKTKGSYDDEVNDLVNAVLGRAQWMDSSVAGFYKTLDRDLCVAAGELPAYNCAANGDDKGCLANPSSYSNAVEFPKIRKPTTAKTCDTSKIPITDVEQPSIDPCWLSAGIYMSDGTITPFCSGYGFCPEGPGANCTCKSGHRAPTCARGDDPIVPHGGSIGDSGVAQKASLNKASAGLPSYDKYLRYPLFFLCALSAMALGVALATRQRRRQHYTRVRGESTASLNDGRALDYGTS